MLKCLRTDSSNKDFQNLVVKLDAYLKICDGPDHPFFAQFNKIDKLKHVVVAYDDEVAIGCGSFKEYVPGVMEIKRMYVDESKRRNGAASLILGELEVWAKELGNTKCILETGKNQPEAIAFYERKAYIRIPNYGQYEKSVISVCFEKSLI